MIKIDPEYQHEWIEKAGMRLGMLLSLAMEKRGVTTTQLAAKVGMLPNVLEMYIKGSETMSIGMYDLLLAHLDVRLDFMDAKSGERFEFPLEEDYEE